jgi:predicted transcriptional regulator
MDERDYRAMNKHENGNDAKLPIMPSLQSLNFKSMRKAKGLTLRKVEDRTGISNAYLSQLETGKIKSPGYETVKALYELYSNKA